METFLKGLGLEKIIQPIDRFYFKAHDCPSPEDAQINGNASFTRFPDLLIKRFQIGNL
jgi:hypothetical protein